MIAECFAIISIVLAIAFIFLRSGRKIYAYGILPLVLVPLVNLLSDRLALWLGKILPFDENNIKICIIFTALIAACLLIGFMGSKFQKKSARTVYLIICGLFTLILSMMFVVNIVVHL